MFAFMLRGIITVQLRLDKGLRTIEVDAGDFSGSMRIHPIIVCRKRFSMVIDLQHFAADQLIRRPSIIITGGIRANSIIPAIPISRITAGIESVLAERGYQMLLAGTDNTPAKEVEYLRLFENYPVDGIILVGTMFTAGHRKFLKETKVPVVVIGQRTSHANCIYHDDYGAGKAMGQAVAGFSKKGVAYIGVTRDDKAAGAAREDGFIAGLKNAGVTLFEENKRTSAFTLESGYESALDLLESKCDIDVISCATDTIAAGAIEAIQTYLKKQIPTNAADAGARMRYILENTSIRVTGFGDNQMLKAVTGGIPTIHFGYKTSGIRGAELLLDSIERGEQIPIEMKLGFRLVGADPSDSENLT